MAPLDPFGYLVTWKTSLPQMAVEYLVAGHKGPLSVMATSAVKRATDE